MRGIPSIAFLRRIALCGALAAALGLSACGGGGGGGGTSVGPPPPDPGASAPLPSKAQAARFLHQATFGATAAEIDRVAQIGYARWLDEQMALPPTLHQPAVPYFTDPFTPKLFGSLPVQSSFWRQAATAPDQLRQRLMFALSEIFVISVGDMNVITYPRGVASYMDTLAGSSLRLPRWERYRPIIGCSATPSSSWR